MPSSVRPKSSGGGNRAPPVTPMSERQQMALLMQMTSPSNNEVGSRSPTSSLSSSSSSTSTTTRSRDRNERGETPLHLAAIKGDIEQVSKLLAHRADPNAADFAGWTPLHEACNHGWYDIAFKLIQSGANVNAKGLDNDTPLHDAAINGHLKLVKLLVERGADIYAKNSKGKTPLDFAPPLVAPYMLNPSLPLPESTASSTRVQPRARDDKKITQQTESSNNNKPTKNNTTSDDTTTTTTPMDTTKSTSNNPTEDVYEFKSIKENETNNTEQKNIENHDGGGGNNEGSGGSGSNNGDNTNSSQQNQNDENNKRNFSEINESNDDGNNDEENRRKKRKEEGGGGGSNKECKGTTGQQRSGNQNKGQSKQNAAPANKTNVEKKSPCPSPKPPTSGGGGSDGEPDDTKSDLKVPPLKIVIPQTNNNPIIDPDTICTTRNGGKSNSQRGSTALPYVLAISNSSFSDSIDKNMVFATISPEGSTTTTNNSNNTKNNNPISNDDKKEGAAGSSSSSGGATSGQSEERSGSHQRVLRSSHRSGQAPDRGSNNSSPQLQRSHSPSPSASPGAVTAAATSTGQNDAGTSTTTVSVSSGAGGKTETQTAAGNDAQNDGGGSTSGTATATAPPVELHPRKRKMKPSKEVVQSQQEAVDTPAEAQVHPHDQPITNCYQLYLNIRKQIDKRRRGLFPVQPKPPQGFKDYLMNRCTYVLASNAPTTPNISYPPTLPTQMKDLFTEQEKDRYRLRMQHVIEKEKLVLSVEQEILRVHGRAARALANQSLPFSVCTILRDEEVYNLITPEQEEKDRNARSRYNGRLFLSWLQDVDDKWEKIKEHMLLRHHNEAESLHAVQKMDWEWKMKEMNLCDRKTTPSIDEHHVPMVHVSDDFDLLPA